jgi:hypothetical protein
MKFTVITFTIAIFAALFWSFGFEEFVIFMIALMAASIIEND